MGKQAPSPVEADQFKSLTHAAFPYLGSVKTGKAEILQLFSKLLDDRGLADAGKAGYKNVLLCAH
jgi:hypothetical protein